ncbi:spore-associated protein [Streptomyces sp. NPDC048142]|uniref:spore-associated protein n=1 Tax=Streptomyces sp. NPDC048142 TaxID=3365501 RepID=UPI003718A2A5
MRISRKIAAAGALTALVVGATAAFSTTASAAPNVTPQDVCGSGYKTVNSEPISSLGTVYLTYNSSNGQNCVATISNSPGTVKYMATHIEVPDTTERAVDAGFFRSYAGPAYVFGRGHCVNWGGTIDWAHVRVDNSNCAALKEHRVTEIR